MFRRALVLTVVLSALAVPARAQFVVIDPANLVQTTLIAYRVQQHYTELRAQYLTVLRMAQRLGNLDPYRIPGIPVTAHDPAQWDFGRPWIEALNTSDASGARYRSVILPLLRPTRLPATLSPAARQMLEREYATVEITDSVASMAGHQVGLARGYHGVLQSAVAALEHDVLNSGADYHEMTAILDKIAAGELLARRQDTLSNQLLSHALEQLLARGKRWRDTEAATINMQLVTWRDGRAANEAFAAGAGDALRTWRQP